MSEIGALLLIVLPVFLLVGFGFAAVKTRIFPDQGIDWLITFATNIAVPALLFRSIYALDLEANLSLGHLASFYGAATACFVAATLLARHFWGRRPGEAVAIGFSALFSNSVLLGIPIAERAFDQQVLERVYALVAFHAAYCYLVGILSMEVTRRDGLGLGQTLKRTARTMFRNALTVGIALGFVFNLAGLPVPRPAGEVLDMLSAAALPVALFGLGGVLTRYSVATVGLEPLMIASLSLVVHPFLAWVLASQVFALPQSFVNAAVVIAAMPPGVNGYIFAAMYGRAVGTAAATVLIATALSVLTVTLWLGFLGGGSLGG